MKRNKLLLLKQRRAELEQRRAQFANSNTCGPEFPAPGDLADWLDPKTVRTKALDVIDSALVDVANGTCDRLMISVPPQEGKSVRISRRFPLWLLRRNPNLRIAIVSYAFGVARRHGRAIRDDIAARGAELGITVDPNSSAAHEFDIQGHDGSVYCVGIKGSLTSRPVDILIVDDPYKDAEQADSQAWQETVRDFWTEVAIPRLGPGAAVVIVQTRWRHDDLSGWLKAQDTQGRWRVINIPAQADHNPDAGESDILGRQPGEYLESARRRSLHDWETKKLEVGSRSWNALYQGRPSPGEGGLFQRGWWRWADIQPAYKAPDGTMRTDLDQVIQSWDMAFKDTKASDYVVGQVWGRRGCEVWLLDQVRDRMDFTATCKAVEALSAKWPQATVKLVEDKANGPAVINHLRQRVSGLIAVEPDGSKHARAAAVAPLVEAGNVHIPSAAIAPWIGDYVEEMAGFPTAAHDDQVDATSQALSRMLLASSLIDTSSWLNAYTATTA